MFCDICQLFFTLDSCCLYGVTIMGFDQNDFLPNECTDDKICLRWHEIYYI